VSYQPEAKQALSETLPSALIAIHLSATTRVLQVNARGKCYDDNFLRFLPILGEKFGVFLKKQCYDQIFATMYIPTVIFSDFCKCIDLMLFLCIDYRDFYV
jgi:hypothetical protein